MDKDLAVAQKRIQDLEIDRSRQEHRIRVLEAALQAEHSTVHSTATPSSSSLDGDTRTSGDASASTVVAQYLSPEAADPVTGFEGLMNSISRPSPPQSAQSASDDASSYCSDEQPDSCTGTPRSRGRSLSIPSTPEPPHKEPSPLVFEASATFVQHHQASTEGTTMYFHSSMVSPMVGTAPCSWYQVAFISGIVIRVDPNVDGPQTGVILHRGEVFAASETLAGYDGRVYLRLADGRGWAFDDSAIFPDDPSVFSVPTDASQSQCFVAAAHYGLTPDVSHHQNLLGVYGVDVPYVPMGECYTFYNDDHTVPPAPLFDADLSLASTSLPLDAAAARHWKRGKRGGTKRRKRGGVKHKARPAQ